MSLNESNKAIECYERHLAAARGTGYPIGEGVSLRLLALSYSEIGNGAEAIRLAKLSLAEMRRMGEVDAPKVEAWLRERGIEL